MDWLNEICITSGNTEDKPTTSMASGRFGRPRKMFLEAGTRMKQIKVQEIVKSNTKEELCLATQIKLYSKGHRDAASLLRKITYSPKKATRLKKAEFVKYSSNLIYSPEEALALFISLKLSRSQYINLRQSAKTKNLKNLYPPYYKLIEAKKNVTHHPIFLQRRHQLKFHFKLCWITQLEEFLNRNVQSSSPLLPANQSFVCFISGV